MTDRQLAAAIWTAIALAIVVFGGWWVLPAVAASYAAGALFVVALFVGIAVVAFIIERLARIIMRR